MTDYVLYRKYRPKTFEEVVGQPHVVKILKNAIKLNRVAHAYLFSGPRGTGKTSVARILARAVNCGQHSELTKVPCNVCRNCSEFLSGRTLDLVEIDAASNRGIDEIRAVREAANFLPISAKYKVYIIDEVHMLTKEAFNALLKTLEEPPAHVIFILATTEPEKIPETISSRAQHLRFRLIDEDSIADILIKSASEEKFTLEKEAADALAPFAEGSLRDALNLLGQTLVLGFEENGRKVRAEDVEGFFGAPPKNMVLSMVSALAQKDRARAFECVSEAIKAGVDPRIFLKILIKKIRADFLSASLANAKPADFTIDELEKILLVFLDAASARSFSLHPELPLELAVSRALGELNGV